MNQKITQDLTGDQWLPLLAPRLDPVLVSTPALARMEKLLQRVPGNAMGAIEVRLADGQDQVDLSFRLESAQQAQQFARCIGPEHTRDFIESWVQDSDPRIPFLWVEFDLDQELAQDLHPFVLSKLAGNIDASWLVETLLPKMQGELLPEDQKALLTRSYSALPPEGSVTYISTLKARGQKAVRMDFYGLSPRLMERHLAELGRPDLAETIAGPGRLLAEAERFHFSHDITSEVLPRIGIEGSFGNRAHAGEPRWRKLFDDLVAEGLCGPEKRDAVLAWIGYDAVESRPGFWPEAVQKDGGFLVRSISHIKLVCHPNKPPEAKTYLLFGHYLRDGNGKISVRKH